MNFNTDQNKKILWDLLSENKYFDNLPIEVMKNMSRIFEAQVDNILEYNKNIRTPTDSIPTPQNKKRFNRAAGVLMKR